MDSSSFASDNTLSLSVSSQKGPWASQSLMSACLLNICNSINTIALWKKRHSLIEPVQTGRSSSSQWRLTNEEKKKEISRQEIDSR